MGKMRTFVITLFLCLTVIIGFSDPMIIDVEKAVELTLENNLNLKLQKIDTDTKKMTKDRVWNVFIPSISASATLISPNPDTALDTALSYDWVLSAGLDVSLTILPQLFFGIEYAILDYKKGLLTLEQVTHLIVRDVRKTFYNLILIKEKIVLLKQQIQLAEKRYNQTVIKFNNGLASEFDVLDSQVSLENLKPNLDELEVAYETAMLSFKQILGIDRTVAIQISGDIKVTLGKDKSFYINPEKLLLHLYQRPDIQIAQTNLMIAKNATKLAFAAFMPTITLFYSADPTYQADPFGGSNLFDTDLWSQRSGAFGLTIVIPLDGLFPYSQTRTDLDKAKAGVDASQKALDMAVQNAEMEIIGIVLDLNKSIKKINALVMNVQLASKAFKLAEEAFSAGTKDLLEVEDAEANLKNAQTNLLQEEFNLQVDILDLEHALNMGIKEILELL